MLVKNIRIVNIIFSVFLVVYGIYFLYNLSATESGPDSFLYFVFGTMVAIQILLGVLSYVYSSKREKLVNAENILDNQLMKEKEEIDKENSHRNKELNEIEEKLFSGLKSTDIVDDFTTMLLSNIANVIELMQGLFYVVDNDTNTYKLQGTYALSALTELKDIVKGTGVGGIVAEKQTIHIINDIPENYIEIISGMGSGKPKIMTVIPVIYDEKTIGIIELFTFHKTETILDWENFGFKEKVGAMLNSYM
ncbi:MAG: hypothetical protein C0594_15500 [Marinilabiliales bacterium]|nr:MAG: hypothetical protein C0594_15500 [Marinilabiliales bacterium]